MDAYGIFEGGVTKGYAHVGALKAAEERGIVFRKIAGTSAGAIVAALVAAGFKADELLDPNLAEGERGVLDLDPLDILDRADYSRISALLASAKGRMRMPRSETYKPGIRAYFRRRWTAFTRSPYAPVLVQALLLGRHGGKVRTAFRDFGMTSSEPLVTWLDRLLRDKVPRPTGLVTFGDLDMRLRVVAANIRTGVVQEFGRPSDHDLPVAPAVIASACFPFFFNYTWRVKQETADNRSLRRASAPHYAPFW